VAYWAGSHEVLDVLDKHAPEVISSAPLEPSQPRDLPSRVSPAPAWSPAPGRDETRPRTRREDRGRGAAAPPPARASATLEVVTDPPLAVSVDGKRVGLAPCKVDVAPGRHRVALSDPERGIRVVRNVNARPGANRLDLAVGRGSVVVTAPPGCEVRIDGRLVGKTPLDEPATVFEGSHRIHVSLGSAQWQQDFTVADGERVTVDVHTEGGAG
jgi:hypothetical protein